MRTILAFFAAALLLACTGEKKETAKNPAIQYTPSKNISDVLNDYKEVELNADLSKLSSDQKNLIAILIEASEIMDELFWLQTYGDKSELLDNISDSACRAYAEINYGPWDRLNADLSFINEIGEKPKGANFYPKDMTEGEFNALEDSSKTGLYTLIKRDDSGELYSVPYHEAYLEKLSQASDLLKKGAEIAADTGLKNYLNLRAEALLNDEYFESDIAWMDMKSNNIDVVIGPIENYEDQLYNYKTAYEAYVLVKDVEWSNKLMRFIAFLPDLQKSLPVDQKYKNEAPGTDSDLNAYDVVYYAGNCNSGGKTIAINLPNDERVQLEKGTRRLQLKNAMRAKFDEIMLPISTILIDPEQRQNVTFDAFFANTMFHEVAHGLGIKNTINDLGPVRRALKEKASAIEEGKADVLGVYMISKLHEMGELPDTDLMDYYVTFMAGIFRSIRFGSTSAHGMANMIRFNFFKEMNAFEQDKESGYYKVNRENFESAINALSNKILVLQGDGDYEAANDLFDQYGNVGPELQEDLGRVNNAGIPKDIVFKQGKQILGL
ncbi:Zn-dependent hydrolase [Hyphobacterium sp. CCMP332]|nr:Zn-dependent hydrolase [Hyphobacterium sp. CCMP332]